MFKTGKINEKNKCILYGGIAYIVFLVLTLLITRNSVAIIACPIFLVTVFSIIKEIVLYLNVVKSYHGWLGVIQNLIIPSFLTAILGLLIIFLEKY